LRYNILIKGIPMVDISEIIESMTADWKNIVRATNKVKAIICELPEFAELQKRIDSIVIDRTAYTNANEKYANYLGRNNPGIRDIREKLFNDYPNNSTVADTIERLGYKVNEERAIINEYEKLKTQLQHLQQEIAKPYLDLVHARRNELSMKKLQEDKDNRVDSYKKQQVAISEHQIPYLKSVAKLVNRLENDKYRNKKDFIVKIVTQYSRNCGNANDPVRLLNRLKMYYGAELFKVED
jgi:hypothetical protein